MDEKEELDLVKEGLRTVVSRCIEGDFVDVNRVDRIIFKMHEKLREIERTFKENEAYAAIDFVMSRDYRAMEERKIHEQEQENKAKEEAIVRGFVPIEAPTQQKITEVG